MLDGVCVALHTPTGLEPAFMPLPVARVPVACVICGGPRRPLSNTPALLCGAPACTQRHTAMPVSRKCRVCTTPLGMTQLAMGVCDNPQCRDEWLTQRPARLAKREWADRVAKAETRRDRAAARRGIPREERETWRVAVLPRNTARASTLPAPRRRAFEAHLRHCVADARARLAAGELPPPVGPAPDPTDRLWPQREAEQALLGVACGTCRGNCCRNGDDHAFIRSDTLLAYLTRFPERGDDEIVQHYLSYIQPRTLTRSCIYQVTDNCSLPRDLRSQTCNRYHCQGLEMIRDRYAPGDPVRAYLVHRTAKGSEQGRLVQIEVRGRSPSG